ncbi:nucleoside recognition domain-containing protein [Aeoliella mucimassa]|uniref:Spore maturation protein A n=1 Tax=Aeoliella mucimassa TaxID=2527972 RepID=A0A518AS86_9BACT|nr:nucleoside recognition domain-containing protein [Aeoliella mucimassa]QDU57584.1 Spore maturation protein A [Aeoliella mucimassa]
MLNKVWFWLAVIGITYGFAKGLYEEVVDSRQPETAVVSESKDPASADTTSSTTEEQSEDEVRERGLLASGQRLTESALNSAKTAVTLCIGLIGIMALWLGLLQIANDAGLIESLARLLRPAMRWLFPDIPDGHPAQGAIIMNLSANMLGLDNAATPMGLKAMQEMQDLNPEPDTATNSMAMFLAINTSNVTLIPFAIIGYRVLYNSSEPTQPIAGTLMVTSLATIVAIFAARMLSKLPMYQTSPVAAAAEPTSESTEE